MLSEIPEGIVVILAYACLGMLSVHVDHTLGRNKAVTLLPLIQTLCN